MSRGKRGPRAILVVTGLAIAQGSTNKRRRAPDVPQVRSGHLQNPADAAVQDHLSRRQPKALHSPALMCGGSERHSDR